MRKAGCLGWKSRSKARVGGKDGLPGPQSLRTCRGKEWKLVSVLCELCAF